MTTAKRSEAFGRLLKAGISSIAHVEGKTSPAVEDDLGQQIGVAGFTIQRYKAGHLPFEPRTVQILAAACVQRGLLGRQWLEKFLYGARYPAPDQLLDQLCPVASAAPRSPRIYENLPAPTYIRFVMRDQLMGDVAAGLSQRTPVVSIIGFGGTGKTSLAREVATRCLRGESQMPVFDAVVWVSDKDHPGTTNLSVLLDEIARTLDYPGFTQFAYDEKRREVEQLLRRQRVLLVVDNFETITDGGLIAWLMSLPEPSKALVTSREQYRGLRTSWLVEVQGMTYAEATTLVLQRLRALRLDRLSSDPVVFAPLIGQTDGNPKAIELALGLIKHEHRTIEQVVDDLAAARGKIFDDLFGRAWTLLTDASRHVLLALTFFTASASGCALQTAAGVQDIAFDQAIEQLNDLALVDIQQADLLSPPRYTIHSLVRSFAEAKLAAEPGWVTDARERWLRWNLELAGQVGFCWNDLDRLRLLDPEHESIYAALAWAFANRRYLETIQLVEGVRYYYNVRGLWDDRLNINLIRAEAARQLGDASNEVLALAHHVEILSKQGLLSQAETYLVRLQAAAESVELSDDARFELHHALALHDRARGDLAGAECRWRDLLPFSERLGGQKYVVNRRWLATCLSQQGQRDEAVRLFRESLEDARRIGDERSVSGNLLKLGRLALDRGDGDTAVSCLEAARAIAEQHNDRRRLGEIQRLAASLHRLQGDRHAELAALRAAADLFERMGMRAELSAMQAELVRLESEPDRQSVGV